MSKERIAELRAELTRLVEEDKAREKREKNAETFTAYARCSNAQYVKALSGDHYAVYRKISDVTISDDFGTSYCKVHECIKVHSWLDEENGDRWGKVGKGWRTGADFETIDVPSNTDREFIQKDDFPITEEEYMTAKTFVLNIIKLQQDFFNNK